MAVVVLLAITFLYTCGNNKKLKNLKKQNTEYVSKIDSISEVVNKLEDKIVSLEDLKILLELEGYKVSQRNLYYNNAIVRTKERPDDIMHQYQEKIDELTTKLK